MKLLIVNNLASGFRDGAIYDFMRAFASDGDEICVRCTDGDTDLADFLRDAEDFDAVVAAGGDGTVASAAYLLAETGIPLLPFPAGTANLLARNLRLPLRRPRAAARAALIGAARPLDAGLADITFGDGRLGRDCFLVVAGLGRDAEAIARTSPRLKRRLGWLAYLRVGASLMGRPPIAMDVTAADAGALPPAGRAEPGREKSAPLEHPCRIDAWTVLVGNCPRLPAGIAIFPDARPDDGRVDLVLASPDKPTDWGAITTRILARAIDAPGIERAQAKVVTFDVDAPIAYQIDGDAMGECSHLEATTLTHVLRIMAPARRR